MTGTDEYVLTGARVLLPDGRLEPGAVHVRAGLIAGVGPADGSGLAPGVRRVGLDGRIVAPGFVDTHVHGGLGFNVMSADVESVRAIGRRLRAAGVTSFVATTASVPFDRILRSVRGLAALTGPTGADGADGADLLGIHLEGPFLSPDFRGVHQQENLVEPAPARVAALLDAAGPALRICTIAPELPHAESAVRRLTAAGVRVSVGHTAATFEQAAAAIGWGARRATHLFNAMPPIHHRNPGPVPALLADPSVYLEIVADGLHVAPELIGALAALPGVRERLMLVSDGTDVSGLPDGDHHRWDGTAVRVTGGRAFTPSGGIAGSTSTLIDGVRVLLAAGVPLPVVLNAAARNPARSLGLTDRGVVAAGRRADLIVLDEEATITHTIVHGQWERP
ncbi:N-acetylglucosamine-6-phosphate deacetylase [Jiangella alkaliphila]|uniref:N-acetylglucosamine-6-phosphate deacetylase n=1 Tax=Jiangella alkaliphila TaxID=419479 RepID=A0A1H2JXE8_9ACTN|nr:N-acetylglucosamine-6-phosphate deacetylase [Jiangella alkaliphila]SDU60953.1 N-acetylglucosamine-6-phosphate deacetylase [Jiangella alkaliphila]